MEDVVIVRHMPACTRHSQFWIGLYNEEYDSYYCEICNRWLEDDCKCGGDNCKYFPDRPDKPIYKEDK